MNAWHVKQAARVLRSGGVVAYPTEAVWGLGCDPWQHAAFEQLLRLKQRPPEKGVILVAADLAQIAPLVEGLPDEALKRLLATWPGPHTWLLPDPHNWIPRWIKGQHAKVAVRVSAHPTVQALCRAWGAPLVSTSANPAGLPPARQGWKVRRYFGTTLDYQVPGRLGGLARPTPIRDLLTHQLLRGAS